MGLFYFGTTFDRAGHFFYELTNKFEDCFDLYSFDKMPFNPEHLPDQFKNEPQTNGRMFHFQVEGYSVIHIVGSCYDKRPGSKSVFFVKGNQSFSTLWFHIRNNPIGKEILNRMRIERELDM